MEDRKKKQSKKDAEASESVNNQKTTPQIKDIDDLIFADEYIKQHSEK